MDPPILMFCLRQFIFLVFLISSWDQVGELDSIYQRFVLFLTDDQSLLWSLSPNLPALSVIFPDVLSPGRVFPVYYVMYHANNCLLCHISDPQYRHLLSIALITTEKAPSTSKLP